MFYRVFRAIVLSIFKVMFRVRVFGYEHVPPQGVYVVAPSHRSILDIPFAAYITRRRIRFMAKQELFTTWIGRRFFNALAAIPVNRESTDRSALRAAQAALDAGEPVGVFPEGTRNAGPVLGDMHDGAAYLAMKLGVPIIPVAIGGSEEIMAPGKLLPRIKRVAVVIGAPIAPPDWSQGARRRADVTLLTQALRTQLQECFDAALAKVATSAPAEVREGG